MVTVRKLVQEGRVYYYLEHPVKIEGKVKKYSKYIGKEIPENLEQLKQHFLLEVSSKRWSGTSDRAREIRRELIRGLSEEELDRMYQEIALSFTTNSLRIEGSTITLLETNRLVRESKTPKNRSHEENKETIAHYEIVYKMLKEKPDLSEGLIMDWHWKIFRESRPSIAGLIKTQSPEKKDGLQSFFNWYSENSNIEEKPMLAAMTHMRLYSVSPFVYGNSIISRLAMNLILHRYDYPVLDIEFGERNRYHDAIRRATESHNESEFLKWFFLKYSRKLNDSNNF